MTWTLDHWLEEVSRWPEGRERYREVANVLLALGRDEEAQAALGRLDVYRSASANVNHTLASRRLLRAQYERLVRDVQRILGTLPRESRVLIASRGDEQLTTLEDQIGWHFPQDAQGIYAGYYPADSEDAIAQLESLRRKGADFLVFPVTSLWWLEHYRGFARYLEERYPVVRSGEPCTIFSLLEAADARLEPVGDHLEQVAITA